MKILSLLITFTIAFAWDIHRLAGLCIDGNDGACQILYTHPIPAEIQTLFIHACLSNDARGCYLAAQATNKPTSHEFYEKGCAMQHATSCYELAMLQNSATLFQKACELGENLACLKHAINLESQKNYKEATELYNHICNSGITQACDALIRLIKAHTSKHPAQ